jgi:hypothetical protein
MEELKSAIGIGGGLVADKSLPVVSFEVQNVTKEEAQNLKQFDHYCTCGGYAHSMNGRPESSPHMDYCPQKPQYDAWYKAMNSGETNTRYQSSRLDIPGG